MKRILIGCILALILVTGCAAPVAVRRVVAVPPGSTLTFTAGPVEGTAVQLHLDPSAVVKTEQIATINELPAGDYWLLLKLDYSGGASNVNDSMMPPITD